MKSLLLSRQYFPPQVGGISRMMAGIAKSLGPERVCCLAGIPGNESADAEVGRVRVTRSARIFQGSKWTRGLRLLAVLAPLILRDRPRALQLATVYEGDIALLLRRLLGMPFLVYAHGNEVLDALTTEWEKLRTTLRTADRVLANSRFTSKLVERAGTDPARIEVVHPGCDTDYYRPLPPVAGLRQRLLPSRPEGPVILTVGHLVARKGHDMVLRALPRVVERLPDVTYLIVGDGPQRSGLEALAKDLGVHDRVVFAGRLSSNDDVRDCYALADVFAMPSRQDLENLDVEGFGIVYIEAGACGKPVVAGRSGGVPEAVLDRQTGILVDPEDPKAISDALTEILADPALATRLGRLGRERAEREFAWPVIAARVDSIIEQMVASA